MCWTRLLLPSDPHPSCPRLSRACPCGHHPQVAFPAADGSSRAWSPSPGEAWVCRGCLTPRRPQLRSLACCLLQYMEKLSQLAYHPLKMQSCYEKMEPLRLDGLQQRFDVSSTSVFKQRAQIDLSFFPVLQLSLSPSSHFLLPVWLLLRGLHTARPSSQLHFALAAILPPLLLGFSLSFRSEVANSNAYQSQMRKVHK